MRYIHFFGNTGYCGTDYHYFNEYTDDFPDAILNQISEDYRIDNASSYEYLATGWDDDFEDDEEEEAYYAEAEGYWEEVSKEEYEKLKEEYEVK